jgi:hypothetical protein
MRELIEAVRIAAGLTPQQASLAVSAVLRYFGVRFPSALLGEIHARLSLPPASPTDDQPPEATPR